MSENRLDLAEVMREIAAGGEIEIPDRVEFNGTLYVRATEHERLHSALRNVSAGETSGLEPHEYARRIILRLPL